MTDIGNGGRIRDPLEESEDKARRMRTSGNREESMTESGEDAFGDDSPIRNTDSESLRDSSQAGDAAQPGKQRPGSSGTTSLGGDSGDAADRKEPGGVEGRE
jgi:hypothetical protein